MTQEIDPEEVSLDEPAVLPPLTQEHVKNPAKTVQFFAGEDTAEFIDRESMLDLTEYAHSLKKTIKDASDKYEVAVAEIKKRLKVETLPKKHIENLGPRQILVTKRAASVVFEVESYITNEFSAAAWKELEETKAMVKDGKVESKYFTRGKESIAVEIV